MNLSDPGAMPTVASIGITHPPKSYTQQELLGLFNVTDDRIKGIFRNSHIDKRYLYLPEPNADGVMPRETPLELANKHRNCAIELGAQAITRALSPLGLAPEDIDYLVCVSSTGFMCPGITAHVIKSMGFRADVHRVDVLGMGCNAGLNALQPLVNYLRLNENAIGLQLCVEVCSAAYVFDDTIRTSIVNCLFGDGAAAVVLSRRKLHPEYPSGPRLFGFQSHIIPEAIDAMRFDFDGSNMSFYLDKDIPYFIGENAHIPVDALLARFGLKRRHVAQWVVHSGGKKVIDSIKYSLDISEHDVRHTTGVLREYGNVSSCSFLFSLQRLLEENVSQPGDHVVLMTMGPGTTIECCLGVF
jgi:predicted naringenin-chalcone synthase